MRQKFKIGILINASSLISRLENGFSYGVVVANMSTSTFLRDCILLFLNLQRDNLVTYAIVLSEKKVCAQRKHGGS